MPVEVKICGLTRRSDAEAAAAAGAVWLGVIFARGPRSLSEAAAIQVVESRGASARAVGVFGAESTDVIARRAERVGLDVVQLQGEPHVADVTRLRRLFHGGIWAALRVESDGSLPAWASELVEAADVTVLDAFANGQLGGSGRPLPWGSLADQLTPIRARRGRIALAGGLTPTNVAEAIALVEPDVADVSSGVESAPGIKDAELVRAFVRAVHGHSRVTRT